MSTASRTCRWSLRLKFLRSKIQLRPEAALRFGVTAGDVRRAAMTLIRGTKVGEIYEDQKIFDVAVWSPERLRSDLPALAKLLIDTPLGGKVPLGDLAELRIAPTPNVIQHENASRRIDVSCNVKGRDLGSVARDIEQRVRSIDFPPGYHPELLGEYAARQASQNRLFGLSILALVGILLVLYTDFKSVRLTTSGIREPSLCAGGRRGSHVPDRWHSVAGFAGRLRDGARHCGEEWRHAGQPLPASGGAGRRSLSVAR